MKFDEVLECAKNGLSMPKTAAFSEEVAHTILSYSIAAYRNRLITSAQLVAEKERAERLFDGAKVEESKKMLILQTWQKNTAKIEELLHEYNFEIKKSTPDKDKIIELLLEMVERAVCFKVPRIKENQKGEKQQ